MQLLKLTLTSHWSSQTANILNFSVESWTDFSPIWMFSEILLWNGSEAALIYLINIYIEIYLIFFNR